MEAANLDFRDRTAAFAAVDGVQFDLLVIGAGITGAGVALDAASRGLKVMLVDARDVAAGTSSRSSKMIHGGLRYLAQGDIELVREAASERQTLRAIAPHLTRLIPFVVPGSLGNTTKMRAGLKIFEKLGSVAKHERHEVWGADELRANEPLLSNEKFTGAVVYPEFLTHDARLTLANVRSAQRAGASVITYAPVTKIVIESGRAVGATIEGALPGESLGATIKARRIVNAAGPWVDAIRAIEDDRAEHRLSITKGIHLVVPHTRLPITRTIAWTTIDKRTVFAVPSGPITYIGTTDTFYAIDAQHSIDWPTIEWDDVSYLLGEAERAFAGAPIGANDIVSMWAGVRPLIRQAGKNPSEISRKDEVWQGPSGVVSIAGGKLTAYRAMAERVVDALVVDLGVSAAPCSTATDSLVGGDVNVEETKAKLAASLENDAAAQRLVNLYGSEADGIVAGGGDLRAEISHAVLHEGALTLADYWVRRGAHSWFTLHPVGDGLVQAAEVAGELLKWSAARRSNEIAEVTQRHRESMACLASH